MAKRRRYHRRRPRKRRRTKTISGRVFHPDQVQAFPYEDYYKKRHTHPKYWEKAKKHEEQTSNLPENTSQNDMSGWLSNWWQPTKTKKLTERQKFVQGPPVSGSKDDNFNYWVTQNQNQPQWYDPYLPDRNTIARYIPQTETVQRWINEAPQRWTQAAVDLGLYEAQLAAAQAVAGDYLARATNLYNNRGLLAGLPGNAPPQ